MRIAYIFVVALFAGTVGCGDNITVDAPAPRMDSSDLFFDAPPADAQNVVMDAPLDAQSKDAGVREDASAHDAGCEHHHHHDHWWCDHGHDGDCDHDLD
jgi:hypothetical protein